MPTYTALSIVAPHGENISAGRKILEVRSWQPPHLPLLNLLIVQNECFLNRDGEIDPLGRAIALVDVHEVCEWTPSQVDDACSSGWAPGYYAWRLANVRPISGSPVVAAERKLYKVEVDDEFVTVEV